MTIQARIIAAVRDGAQTVPEIAALLDDQTEQHISAHCSNLHKAGKLTHLGQVRYPGSPRLTWRYGLPDDGVSNQCDETP